VSGQIHAPAALSSGTHWIGVWVGPRAGVNLVVAKRKIPASIWNRAPVIQPVA